MLEVGWWGVGSLRDVSKNILKQGLGKGKSCSYGGGGFEGVTTPAPPPKKKDFNHTQSKYFLRMYPFCRDLNVCAWLLTSLIILITCTSKVTVIGSGDPSLLTLLI